MNRPKRNITPSMRHQRVWTEETVEVTHLTEVMTMREKLIFLFL